MKFLAVFIVAALSCANAGLLGTSGYGIGIGPSSGSGIVGTRTIHSGNNVRLVGASQLSPYSALNGAGGIIGTGYGIGSSGGAGGYGTGYGNNGASGISAIGISGGHGLIG